MANTEPMTDERLAEIREMANLPFNGSAIMRELLAEVEWSALALRQSQLEVEALHSIIDEQRAALAAGPTVDQVSLSLDGKLIVRMSLSEASGGGNDGV